jgi:hypothetical protein
MHTFDPLCVFSSDLPGFDPTTFNWMILYYRLMIKWCGLADSTELSWMQFGARRSIFHTGQPLQSTRGELLVCPRASPGQLQPSLASGEPPLAAEGTVVR